MTNSKFENLILYICKKGADDSRLGRTKLNKILFYCDFGHNLVHGASISGEEYMAIANGPVPRRMKPVLDRLLRDGRLREDRIETGMRPMQKPVATVDPDLSEFRPEEISFVDDVLNRFRTLTGTELSNMTHAEPAYDAAYERETIPYAAFYLKPFVEAEKIEAKTTELAGRFGWNERYAA